MLRNKHIVLGVTGGVAAYKAPLLTREFRKRGAQVRIVMTEPAAKFVAPLTLSTLSGHEVVVGLFPPRQNGRVDAGVWHIEMGRWADAMLIAPATANTVAKLAHGYADNAVTTLALALRCPLILAPAMDVDMWQHPATQENVGRLRDTGCAILPPDEGELASGLVGPGRLPEIVEIADAVENIITGSGHDLKGRNILVSAGPTHEPIDPVRFLTNRSSGKMGFAIANAAALRGADVTLVAGPVQLPTPRNVRRVDVRTAREMHAAVLRLSRQADVIVMAAAVADFTPADVSSKKIKKGGEMSHGFLLVLKTTTDILQSLAERKPKAVMVGFALETNNGLANAKEKLKRKKLDFIVLNNPLQEGAGFGEDTNIVTLLSKSGMVKRFPQMTKFAVANEILDHVKKARPR